ncbi:hypothetical protein ACFE04_028772 [Oxalis oulophora]
MATSRNLLLLLVGLVLLVVFTRIFASGKTSSRIIGWFCVAFSVGVFASPSAVLRNVLHTQSVEYMPIELFVVLTLCAIVSLVNIWGSTKRHLCNEHEDSIREVQLAGDIGKQTSDITEIV